MRWAYTSDLLASPYLPNVTSLPVEISLWIDGPVTPWTFNCRMDATWPYLKHWIERKQTRLLELTKLSDWVTELRLSKFMCLFVTLGSHRNNTNPLILHQWPGYPMCDKFVLLKDVVPCKTFCRYDYLMGIARQISLLYDVRICELTFGYMLKRRL